MSCCGSLFVNLGGGGGGTVNTGVLQIAGGVPLDSTLRFVEDQNGTDSILKLSTTEADFGNTIVNLRGIKNTAVDFLYLRNDFGIYGQNNAGSVTFMDIYNDRAIFGSGTHTQNGYLSVKGNGGNIASFRDSTNVEKLAVSNAGVLTTISVITTGDIIAGASAYIGFTGKSIFSSPSDGIFTLNNNAASSFTRLNFGGLTTNFPAIASTNTPAALAAKDATGANLIPFSAEDFTSGNLSSGTLTTARPMQFGDKGTITDAGLVALGLAAQIAVEHNGNVYYIPCSTSLIS